MTGFEHRPGLYDGFMKIAELAGLGRWRRRLTASATGRVLDLGTGTGRNLPHLPRSTAAVGVDPDLRLIRRARGRAHGGLLVVARAERLPFRSGVFDTVVTGFVFCSVSDPESGLEEVRRVLASAGTVRMLEHVRSGSRLVSRLQDAVQPAWTAITGGCHPNRDTGATVRAAGFAVTELRGPGVLRLLSAVPRHEADPVAGPTRGARGRPR